MSHRPRARNEHRLAVAIFSFIALSHSAFADSAADWEAMKAMVPRYYVCARAETPPRIDGRLDESVWELAPWTDDFVDIEGDRKPRPRLRTRAKMTWDSDCFYIAAEMKEPHVWGTLTRHDSVIFNDNDFEVFIDPDGDNHEYCEFEINALNTGWDLFLPRPYKDGGTAENRWEIPGLRTAVHVDGTLNDPSDQDRGWSIEIAIPWAALREFAHRSVPPRDGDQWRVNFSRVEWQHKIDDKQYLKVPDTKEDNWVWSPQGIIDMHRPERWGYVQFSILPPRKASSVPDPTLTTRNILLEIYHHQKAFWEKNGHWAKELDQLGLDPQLLKNESNRPQLRTTDNGFRAIVNVPLPYGEKQSWSIRQDSRIRLVRSDDDLSETIEGILTRQAEAWNRGDLDAFMEYYWKSDELTFSSGGRTSRGWTTTKENYKRRYPTRERMGHLSFGAIEITVTSETGALVLGRWNLQRDPAPIGGNFSLLFKKIEDHWLIIHDHTSLEKEPSAE